MPRPSKKTILAASKTAKWSEQLTTDQVGSIIASALNSIAPTAQANVPTTPKSPGKKRKTVVAVSDNDSSGLEIIEGPRASPKKARPATPPSGTSAFKNLSGVSFANDLDDKVANASQSLSFGSTGRPSRTKTKTEKGALLEDIKLARKTRAKRSANKSTVIMSEGESDAPANTTLTVSPKLESRKKSAKPSVPLSDDDLPEVSDLMLSSPKKTAHASKSAKTSGKRLTRSSMLGSPFNLEAVDSEDESASSDHYLATDDSGSVGYVMEYSPTNNVMSGDNTSPHAMSGGIGNSGDMSSDCASSGNVSGDDTSAVDILDPRRAPGDRPLNQPTDDHPDEDPNAVTSGLYQEDGLQRIYNNLPFLENLCPIIPFSHSSSTVSSRMKFNDIAPTLAGPDIDSVMKAFLFTQSGFFVNFSRIHPNLLRQDNGRIRMAQPDNVAAVGLYTGLCTQGMIIDVDRIGPPHSQYEVHGLVVAGTDQDTRRYMALLGKVLGYDSIPGSMTRGGLAFYTRGQGKNGNFGNIRGSHYISSPGGPPISTFVSTVSMPGPATSGSKGYPASRSFDDQIIVYDGRAKSGRKFNFTDTDFNDLPSWPRYRNGLGEIEPDTIVSVGHTVGTYNGSHGGRFLSTNVHFVIVLGRPALTI